MPSSVMRSIGRAMLFALLLGAPAARLHAQAGTLQGTVTDSSGVAIVGAAVTLDQLPERATTTIIGHYALRGAPVGRQTVRVRAIGFSSATRKVTIAAGTVTELNITMNHKVTTLATVDVLVGSRGEHTAAEELAVPVDVYTTQQIQQIGSSATSTVIANLSPSINFPTQSVTDANEIVKPFTLRGLSPDHTLVLINGWRQHATALLNTFPYGSPAGSSGVDLNAIPSGAIERIEVLRDGASAQYGSDAIAGVVNLKMKSGTFDPFLNTTGGFYYTGHGYPVDGQQLDLNGGYGFAIGRSTLALTLEYQNLLPTNRAWADGSLANLQGVTDSVDPSNGRIVQKRNAIPQPNLHWGDGLEQDLMTYANFKAPVNEDGTSEFYAFGGYSHRVGTGNGYYRSPSSNRNWPELYANGFLPEFHPDVVDYSGTVGYRALLGGWATDLGASYGHNSFDYNLRNTNNASLGPSLSTPTAPGPDGKLGTSDDPGIPNQLSFFAGGLQRGEFITGLNLSKPMDWGWRAPVSVSFGAVFRRETYEIKQGETASWINGNHLAQDSSGPAPSGSSVFPGFAPSDASNNHRQNIGVYAELENEVSPSVLLNLAGRYEDYSDFGSSITGKFAVRWQAAQRFIVRGAASTGFRAPGLPQSFFSHVTTNVIGGTFVEVGNYPVTNPAAVLFGAQPLKPEDAVNVSAGFAYTPVNNFTFTVDGFWIQITNRIILGQTYDGSSDYATDSVLKAHGFTTIGGLQFFTNGLDTRTSGVDFAANWVLPAGVNGTWNLNLGLNWTQTAITRTPELAPVLVNTSTTYTAGIDVPTTLTITKERPDWRGILAATYTNGRFHSLGRVSYYGQLSSAQPGVTNADAETYSPRTLIDLEVGYQFSDVNLSMGARNLFDIYPGRMMNPDNNNGGTFPWAAASPFGFNGRFLYVRANMVLVR